MKINASVTVEDVVTALGLDLPDEPGDYIARDLLNGVIEFELRELIALAKYKGISVEELTK